MIKKLWQDIWTVLNTEIPIPWAEAIAGGVESTQAVLDLAQALDDNRTIQELTPLISHLSSMLNVLNAPVFQVAGAAFVVLFRSLLAC